MKTYNHVREIVKHCKNLEKTATTASIPKLEVIVYSNYEKHIVNITLELLFSGCQEDCDPTTSYGLSTFNAAEEDNRVCNAIYDNQDTHTRL